MQPIPKNLPVVIVGAGPTGLTSGLLLAEYGIKSIILERNHAPMDIPRAIILDDEGARTLQCFGADKTYVTTTIKADGAAYIDDDGAIFGRVGSGAETYGFAKRHFISQPEMEAALLKHIETTPLCDVRFGCDVTSINDSGSNATLNISDPDNQPHQITAQYVIAADGGRSQIREDLGIKMSGSTYAQDWLVIDTRNDPDQDNFSKFICSTTRPHVSIPAPNGGRRYEFMLLKEETHEEVLKDAFVNTLMAPYRTLTPDNIIRKIIYTFHARIADQFRKGRVFLAGDAAHLTPPFAGQGMNAGLRDAANLSWKLAAVINGRANDQTLDSYFDERKTPAWAMIQLAVAMGDVVMPIEPDQQAFRAQLLKAMAPFPEVQSYLMEMRFKPRPKFDQGLFLEIDDQPFEHALVGEMIPQPDVKTGTETTKLDTILGIGFSLIAQDEAGATALSALDMDQFCGLPLTKITLNTHQNKPTGFETATVTDPRGKSLRTHRDQIMLIRPDRYCAAAFSPSELETSLRDFATLLGIQTNQPIKT